MTTYPLSEQATIYAAEEHGAKQVGVVGQGTLAECAEIIQGFSQQRRTTTRVEMKNLDIQFDPEEVSEMLRFLQDESAGLSNHEVKAITDPDR